MFASDMFHTMFEKDPMDPQAGLRYRKCILEKGASQPEMTMLVDLLGRPPDHTAFLKEIAVV